MRMTSNHLLCEPITFDKVGSIHLTEKMKFSMDLGRPRVMRVLALGPGRLTRKGVLLPIECNPGDRVIVHSYTDGAIDLPDGNVIINDQQILAVLPK